MVCGAWLAGPLAPLPAPAPSVHLSPPALADRCALAHPLPGRPALAPHPPSGSHPSPTTHHHRASPPPPRRYGGGCGTSVVRSRTAGSTTTGRGTFCRTTWERFTFWCWRTTGSGSTDSKWRSSVSPSLFSFGLGDHALGDTRDTADAFCFRIPSVGCWNWTPSCMLLSGTLPG